ncbi:unnamed protein product [Bemisia tabaci]|uniref:Myb/SANT-like DNA-binding domain-containing protein n=1 Tax=Bemisia tabaci TaxID=7038 RepID=A0A9P0A7X2_BEMTA|nr:unnamed protein product [Bemisia tabaci]
MWVLIRLNVITLRVELPDAQYLRMREDVTYKIKIISEILVNARNAGLLPNVPEKVKLLGFEPADNPLEESGSASTPLADITNSTPANRPADNLLEESGSVQRPLADRTDSTPANREVLPFKWTSASIKLLLQLRWAKEEQFARPPTKKSKLWVSIANSMAEHGYLVSGPSCDAKYRNLKNTYQSIRLRLLKTGEGREIDGKTEESPSWEFYGLFRDNIGTKASVEPDEGLLGGTFDEAEKPGDTSFRKVSSPEEEKGASFLKGKRKRVKTQPELTVKQYLHQKNAKDEQKAEQQRELMRQRLELRRRRLELEEERIKVERERTAAIQRLAGAVEARRSAAE